MAHIQWTEHNFRPEENEEWVCTKCGRRIFHFKNVMRDESECPGAPIIRGGWDNWPDGLITKQQLYDEGYSIGKTKLPPVAAYIPRKKSPGGYMALYDPEQAVKRKKMSAKQRVALNKAHQKSMARYYCPTCSVRLADFDLGYGDCHRCRAIETAKAWLESEDAVILDTETTDLHGEVIQIAIINLKGEVLMYENIKPEGEISEEAYQIHGISGQDLQMCPMFFQKRNLLRSLTMMRPVYIYNASYDVGVLQAEFRRVSERSGMAENWQPWPFCVMELYAQYVGDWSYRHKDFRWQRLPGGDHDALGDAQATLKLLKDMAEGKA